MQKEQRSLKQNAGCIASKCKLRCNLLKKKYDIPDCLDVNHDKTKLDVVPSLNYTMDERGLNEMKGEKMDDERCVTGFCGRARTDEAAKMQYINKGMIYIHFIL